jgi:hypothetical protein
MQLLHHVLNGVFKEAARAFAWKYSHNCGLALAFLQDFVMRKGVDLSLKNRLLCFEMANAGLL